MKKYWTIAILLAVISMIIMIVWLARSSSMAPDRANDSQESKKSSEVASNKDASEQSQDQTDDSKIPPHWRGLAKLLAPTAPTSKDWKRLKIQGDALNFKDGNIAYAFALNIFPLLQADKNTDANHVKVAVKRNAEGGIITSMWGHKMQRTLVIDWSKGKVEQAAHSEAAGLELDDAPPGERYKNDISIGFGVSPKDDRQYISLGVRQLINDEKKYTAIPYNYTGYWYLSTYGSLSYPIAVTPKVQKQPRGFATIMVFDVPNAILLGEISLPPEVAKTRPVFALDKETNVLISTGYDLQWMLVIDLNSYIQKLKTK